PLTDAAPSARVAARVVHRHLRRLLGEGVTISAGRGGATVRVLLRVGSPAAVGRLVVAVDVNAVEGHPLGAVAHVGIEVGEVAPAITDADAPPAVVRPLLVVGVVAAGDHRLPYAIELRVAHAVRGHARTRLLHG